MAHSDSASLAIQTAMRAGNINVGGGSGSAVMELSASSIEEQEKHAQLLRRVEAERRARSIVVPTNKDEVRAQLRSLGQPVRKFGEDLADIRERLRELLARIEIDGEEMVIAGLSAPVPPGGQEADGGVAAAAAAAAADKKKAEQSDVYTEASEELMEARRSIFKFSTGKAASRLAGVKIRRASEEAQQQADVQCRSLYDGAAELGISGSQLGDERPLACVKCSPLPVGGGSNGGKEAGASSSPPCVVATGSLAHFVKLWDAASMEHLGTLGGGAGSGGHTERITGLDWHPGAFGANGFGTGARTLLATGSADSTCKIWSITAGAAASAASSSTSSSGEGSAMADDDNESSSSSSLSSSLSSTRGGNTTAAAVGAGGKCVMTLEGHKHRLGMVCFHPAGEYVGTASFDRTFRLWHCESGKEVLLQDGHLKEVHFLSFQKDGALAATGDFSGVGSVWDLRAGRKVFSMQGHVKRIVSGDFSPNGFQVVTGGDDHTVRVWDLRQRQCSYVVPAHGNLVSSCRFHSSGDALLTTSFDGKCRVWGTRDWRLLTELSGHEGKVMGGDWHPSSCSSSSAGGKRAGLKVFSVGFDRTLKRWEEEGSGF